MTSRAGSPALCGGRGGASPALTCGAAQQRGAGTGPAQAQRRGGEEHRFVIGVRRHQQRADAMGPRRRPNPAEGASPVGRVTAPQAAGGTEQPREERGQQQRQRRRAPAPRPRCHGDRRRARAERFRQERFRGTEGPIPLPSPPASGRGRSAAVAETCPGSASVGLARPGRVAAGERSPAGGARSRGEAGGENPSLPRALQRSG